MSALKGALSFLSSKSLPEHHPWLKLGRSTLQASNPSLTLPNNHKRNRPKTTSFVVPPPLETESQVPPQLFQSSSSAEQLQQATVILADAA